MNTSNQCMAGYSLMQVMSSQSLQQTSIRKKLFAQAGNPSVEWQHMANVLFILKKLLTEGCEREREFRVEFWTITIEAPAALGDMLTK